MPEPGAARESEPPPVFLCHPAVAGLSRRNPVEKSKIMHYEQGVIVYSEK